MNAKLQAFQRKVHAAAEAGFAEGCELAAHEVAVRAGSLAPGVDALPVEHEGGVATGGVVSRQVAEQVPVGTKEFGNSRQVAQPYFRPGIRQGAEKMRAALLRRLKVK